LVRIIRNVFFSISTLRSSVADAAGLAAMADRTITTRARATGARRASARLTRR
jgi:hypothetical protein